MAARQLEEGRLSRSTSPHYVNENPADDREETKAHSLSSGNATNGAANQEGSDYVNAPFISTPNESPSSTACRASESTLDDENGYVKQNVYPSDVANDRHSTGSSVDFPDDDGTFIGRIRDSGITSGGDTSDKTATPEYVDTDQPVRRSMIVGRDKEECDSSIESSPEYVNVVTVVGVDGRAESSC